MLKIAVCDDEQFYREKMQCLLKNYFRRHGLQYTIQTFVSGEAFLESALNHVKYDIVFMDISMDGADGIQTAQQMRSLYPDTWLVLVTAYIDYALRGMP